jgi:arginine decarboxylase-like protein
VRREEALRAFKLGVLSLEERAAVDLLFDATCNRILHLAAAAQLPLPEALQPSTRPHSATYHVNLSSKYPSCHDNQKVLDSGPLSLVFPACLQ